MFYIILVPFVIVCALVDMYQHRKGRGRVDKYKNAKKPRD